MKKSKINAVKDFLMEHSPLGHLYYGGMEVQVSVAQGDGEPISREYLGTTWKGFAKGKFTVKVKDKETGEEKEEVRWKEEWKPFRIPYKANSTPEYKMESPMTYDVKHINGIGLSGWDWIEKKSKYVVYDFDALVGHSVNNPNLLSDDELQEIQDKLADIDWVTIRRSTSGKGLHVYVFVDDVTTNTHTEHSALAKSILDLMSLQCDGYSFKNKIDVCGHIFWIWHEKMFDENGVKIPRAFELLKEGRTLRKDEIPFNWKEQTKVITGEVRKLSPFPVLGHRPDLDALFDEITGKKKKIELDEGHQLLIKYLESRSDQHWYWSADYHMLVTHTAVLRDAHKTLNFKGFFETTSGGSNLADPNCFCYPLPDGAWSVLRYGKGIKESESWIHEEDKYTRCYYNQKSNFYDVCRHFKGAEDPDGKIFQFESTDILVDLMSALGEKITLPEIFRGRSFYVEVAKKDSLLSIIIPKEGDDPFVEGWFAKSRPNRWAKKTNISVLEKKLISHEHFDSYFRHVTLEDEALGWRMKNSNDQWVWESLVDVRNVAKSKFPKLNDGELTRLIGESTDKAWKQVNHPFDVEYTGDREWNYIASQLSFKPTRKPIMELKTPTWDLILNRLGKCLDDPIARNKKLTEAGISNGGDYLKCWIASMLQNPFDRTPYLFFYGDQDSGKSTFHEAVSMLFTKGAVSGKEALSSKGGFNGELRSAIFVYVEEKDLSRDPEASARLKEWVTSLTIPLNTKYLTPSVVPNSTHWIQCGNSHNYVPIEYGDTRVVVIEVGKLLQEEKIGKNELVARLRAEIPDFLGVVMQLELPKFNDRLAVPVINTKQKNALSFGQRDELKTFLSEKVKKINGSTIPLSEFYSKFQDWLEDSDKTKWSTHRVMRDMPPTFPQGMIEYGEGTCFIGNIAWVNGSDLIEEKPELITEGGRLKDICHLEG